MTKFWCRVFPGLFFNFSHGSSSDLYFFFFFFFLSTPPLWKSVWVRQVMKSYWEGEQDEEAPVSEHVTHCILNSTRSWVASCCQLSIVITPLTWSTLAGHEYRKLLQKKKRNQGSFYCGIIFPWPALSFHIFIETLSFLKEIFVIL